jgi:MoxR-like ATPase
MDGRNYVTPEDIKEICKDVLRHRIGLTYEAQAERISTENIIDELLQKKVKTP